MDKLYRGKAVGCEVNILKPKIHINGDTNIIAFIVIYLSCLIWKMLLLNTSV